MSANEQGLHLGGYIAPILECASFKRDVAHLQDWQNPRVRIDDYTAGSSVMAVLLCPALKTNGQSALGLLSQFCSDVFF